MPFQFHTLDNDKQCTLNEKVKTLKFILIRMKILLKLSFRIKKSAINDRLRAINILIIKSRQTIFITRQCLHFVNENINFGYLEPLTCLEVLKEINKLSTASLHIMSQIRDIVDNFSF